MKEIRYWTAEELNTLRTKYKEFTAEEIHEKFLPHRSVYGIRMALYKHGISETVQRAAHAKEYTKAYTPWTPEEDQILIDNIPDTPIRKIQETCLPDRSLQGIKRRAKRLGLIKSEKSNTGTTARQKHKPYTTWNQTELATLLQYYDTLTPEEIHEKYLPSKTAAQIRVKAHNEGLSVSYFMNYKFWTEEELKILRENAATHTAKDMTALLPKRSQRCIWNKANELGIQLASKQSRHEAPDRHKRWTEHEIKILIEHYPHMSVQELKAQHLPNRSIMGIRQKINDLTKTHPMRKLQRKE